MALGNSCHVAFIPNTKTIPAYWVAVMFLNDLLTLVVDDRMQLREGGGGGGGQTALFVNYTMLLVELEGHCSVTMTTPSQLTARRDNNAPRSAGSSATYSQQWAEKPASSFSRTCLRVSYVGALIKNELYMKKDF